MILHALKVVKIVSAKPRSYLLIQNLSASDVFISTHEYTEVQDYTNNSVALMLEGMLEINPCLYQGDIYAYSVDQSDIRVLEL